MKPGLESTGAGERATTAAGRWLVPCLLTVLVVILSLLVANPAAALKPIAVTQDQERIEITARSEAEAYAGRGDNLQVETAPGADGATERLQFGASTPGLNPNWLVFALTNTTDKPLELWLTADRYNASGSGVVWPDLDTRRITAVKHSSGFAPEHVRNDRVDIFRLTLERGQTVTYVVELATERVSRMYLWRPLEFEQRQRERHLFNGIMLGVMGLMAVFLTAVFAANHKMIFPAAALVSWCVLGLLCVDFGFWHKLFQMRPEDNAQYRAAAEAAIAASLVLFLFTFLRVNLWHGFARILFVAWIVGQLAIVALAVLDPKLSATVARMSIAVIGGLGTLIIGILAARRLERALALVPTWLLFLVWLFGAGATLTGRLPGDAAISGLVAGLVLIMVLIGFTVTQFAFRANEPAYGINPSQRQLRLAAIEQAGVSVWEWSARRNEIKLDAEIEAALGLAPGDLPSKVEDLVTLLHPADRERFTLALEAMRQHEGGQLRMELRLRHTDSSYRCFEIEGATVPTRDRRTLRCVGVVRDVTDAKRANERLLHDAVHDSLTGLPNRELLVDRIDGAMARVRAGKAAAATVFYVDLDRFRAINSQLGIIVGDSILLTMARRLLRGLGPEDTLARISGDRFALLVTSISDVRELARLAEQLRLALKSPIRIAGQEIVLTGAIGIAMFDRAQANGRELLMEAEIAMWRAKRGGAERLEIFNAELRPEKEDRAALAAELRQAIAGNRLVLLYRPVVALSTEELVGFETVVRWDHAKLGRLWPADLGVVAEDGDLASELGLHVLGRAASDIARWQKELARPDLPLFVTVDVASRRLLKPELAQELRHIIGRAVVAPGSLRLAFGEAVVMENPEQASQILDLVAEVGVGLTLDGVGAGYSSLPFLARFPFDTLEIDPALVQLAGGDDQVAALVRSLVAMGNELGRKMAASGVETPEDAAFLRAIGCATAQGFYYGEPMGETEIERLLRLIRKADRRMRRRGLVRGQEKRKSQAPPQAPAGTPAGEPPAPTPSEAPLAAQPAEPLPQSAQPLSQPAQPVAQAAQPPSQPVPMQPAAAAAPSRMPPHVQAGTPPSRPLVQPPPGDLSRPVPPARAPGAPANGAWPPPAGARPASADAQAPVMPSTARTGPPAEPLRQPPPQAAPGSVPMPPAGLAPAASAALPSSTPSLQPPAVPRAAPLTPAAASQPTPIVSPAQSAPLRPVDAPRAAPSVAMPTPMSRQAPAAPPSFDLATLLAAAGEPLASSAAAPPVESAAPDTRRAQEPAYAPPRAAAHLPTRSEPAREPPAVLPPALAELQAALDDTTGGTARSTAPPTGSQQQPPAAPASPRTPRLQRRPPRTGDRTLPPSVAASLAKIAGRTAAARLVSPSDADAAGTDEADLMEQPARPPRTAAE